MDVKRSFAKRVVVWLVVGLIGGGIAADWWERHRAANDIADLKVRHADQLKESQAKLEQKIEELSRDLNAERQRREALERALADLHKGS
jgi:Skp family chaperone for outer membrane proteins